MPSELISQLVLEVSRYKKVNLGEREAEFLARIGAGENSSYRIYSFLKKMGLPMDYKNVNKRVRRLQELGLIKEIRDKGESIHNAKFFALTSEGIFYLLAQYQPTAYEWLIEYKNNLILRALLYQYFEEENTIRSLVMLIEIGRYFSECCHIIQLSADFIKMRQQDDPLVKEKVLKQLQLDLEWQAKDLAIKALTPANKALQKSSAIHYSNLVKDKKFMELAKNALKIGEEYKRAFSKLLVESVSISDSVNVSIKKAAQKSQ